MATHPKAPKEIVNNLRPQDDSRPAWGRKE
jgi:hypothetical protein